jgi:hypothetical protein
MASGMAESAGVAASAMTKAAAANGSKFLTGAGITTPLVARSANATVSATPKVVAATGGKLVSRAGLAAPVATESAKVATTTGAKFMSSAGVVLGFLSLGVESYDLYRTLTKESSLAKEFRDLSDELEKQLIEMPESADQDSEESG